MVTRNALSFERQVACAFVLLVSLLIAIWHPGERSAFWQGVEGRLLDARFHWRGPTAPPDEVAIIAFDDAAMSQLQTFAPPRSAMARAVSAASAAGAKAIALDFLLVDPRFGDTVLAEALANSNTVLGVAEAPVDAELQSIEKGDFGVVITDNSGNPLPALGPAGTLRGVASIGHVILRHDSDGAARRLEAARNLAIENGNAWYPSLALAAMKASDDGIELQLRSSRTGGHLLLKDTSIALDLQGAIPLNFYGKAGTIPTYSFAEFGGADLQGKTVFIGATATGFGDRHATSFDASFPGVELHATLAANVIDQSYLRRDLVAWAFDIGLALTVSVLGFGAAGFDRLWFGALGIIILFLASAIVLQTAFTAGWWLDSTTVLLSLFFGVFAGASLRFFQHRRRAVNLALYQSPLLVDKLANSAEPRFDTLARPAAVLFVDVADFTTYSESIGPERTADFLRLFHGLIEQTSEPLHGIITHFAGDGAMVVFGAPEPDPNDTIHALRFIEALYAAIHSNSEWPGLGLRVGGNCGPVRTSVIGGKRHKQLAVSGDTVNTASRLQEFARSQNAAIAVSSALLQGNSETLDIAKKIGLRSVGRHTLRGRREQIEIWTGLPPRRI